MNAILITMSDLYFFPGKVCIASIKKYCNNRIFVGDLGLSLENKRYLNSLDNVEVISFPNELKDIIQIDRWPVEYLIKYTSIWTMPKEFKRILCLGSDMIVQKNLDELFEIDLENYAFAASVENDGNTTRRFKLFTQLPADRVYCNAETLLINREYIQEHYSLNEFFDMFKKYQQEYVFFDQDFINYCFYGKIKPISILYNFQISQTYKTECFYDGLENASIIHFSCVPKPWNYKCKPQWVKLYYDLINEDDKKEIISVLYKSIIMRAPIVVAKFIRDIIRKLRRNY